MRLKNSIHRAKNQADKQRFKDEREAYKIQRTGALPQNSATQGVNQSVSQTVEQSQIFSQRQRQEVTETKIDRVIHHNADGTSITKETVMATTKAEEVITTIQTTIRVIHMTAVTAYRSQLSTKYAKDCLFMHDRVQYLTKLLQSEQSPFANEKLYTSIQSMTLWDLVEREGEFLLLALMNKDARTMDEVLANIPTTSALAEMIRTVKRDVDIYLPYQVFRDAMSSEDVEEEVRNEGRRVFAARLGKHLDDPKVRFRENVRAERRRRGIFDFGDRFVNMHEIEDLEAQEKLQRKLASKCVADQLGMKGWTADRSLKFDTVKQEHEEQRMESSVSIYDQFNDCCIDDYNSIDRTMFEIWEQVLKPRVLEHYLIMQLMMGAPLPPDISIHPESVEHTTHRQVKGTSFFFANYYKYWNSSEPDEVAHFTVFMPRSWRIGDVCVQMAVLHKGWSGPFQQMVTHEASRYQADPGWAKVTPENLILRHLAQASPGVTESIDKLLAGRYADDGKTQQQLLDMVGKVYVDHDPKVASPSECLHFSHLAGLLPTSYKLRLDKEKRLDLSQDMLSLQQMRNGICG